MTTGPTSAASQSNDSADEDSGSEATGEPAAGTIVDVVFHAATLRNVAPGNAKSCRGCDNWPITETASGLQFSSFGDGNGFDGGAKASLGVARLEGGKDDYSAFDVFKSGTEAPGFDGKSHGLLALGDVLYLWRSGDGSNAAGYNLEELYTSIDDGVTWSLTNAAWYPSDFSDQKGFAALTFCQFGPGYADAPDEYVYVYGFEEEAGDWDVQFPGRIALLRVPATQIDQRSAYEYFAGLRGGVAQWTSDLEARAWVFEDPDNGAMRLSVTYRAPIAKYILMVQQTSRTFPDARLGIYQADAPWGPFTDAMATNPADPKTLGAPIPIIADGSGDELEATKTVFFGISNKWSNELREPGGFVMVYTGDWEDEWGTMEGEFVLANR